MGILNRRRGGLGIGALAALTLASWTAGGVSAASLLPHRALYTMKLAAVQGTGGPSNVRGVMTYVFKEQCDSWTVESKVYLRLQYGDGPEIENVRTMATWESKDGKGYRFRVEESRHGKTIEEIKGVAVLDGAGQGGIAEFSKPRRFKVELPKGTIFPSRHIDDLIVAGRDGRRHLGKVVFDGATLENPYEISAVISKSKKPARMDPVARAALPAARHWRSRLAYFPFAKNSPTPEFELGVNFRSDGIVEQMIQDLGAYAIDAQLNQIQLLPRAKCPQ